MFGVERMSAMWHPFAILIGGYSFIVMTECSIKRREFSMWIVMLLIGIACFALLAAFTWACDCLLKE